MDYKMDRQKRQESRLKARSATWEPSGRPCTLEFVFDGSPSQVKPPEQAAPVQRKNNAHSNFKKSADTFDQPAALGAVDDNHQNKEPQVEPNHHVQDSHKAIKSKNKGSTQSLDNDFEQPMLKAQGRPMLDKAKRGLGVGVGRTKIGSSSQNITTLTTKTYAPLENPRLSSSCSGSNHSPDDLKNSRASQNYKMQCTVPKRKRRLDQMTTEWSVPPDDGRRRKQVQFGLALGIREGNDY